MNKTKGLRVIKIFFLVIVSLLFMAASECQCTIETNELALYDGTWYLSDFYAQAYRSGKYYYPVIDEQEFCQLHKIIVSINKNSAYFKIQGDDFFNSQGLYNSTYSVYGSFKTLNSYDSYLDGYIEGEPGYYYLYSVYDDVYHETVDAIFGMFGSAPIDVPAYYNMDLIAENMSIDVISNKLYIYGYFDVGLTTYYFELEFSRSAPSYHWEFANRIWYVESSPEFVYYFSPACVLDREYGVNGNMVAVRYIDYDGVPEFDEYSATLGIDIYYNWNWPGYYYVNNFSKEYHYYSYDGFSDTFQSDATDSSEYVTFVNFPIPSASVRGSLKPRAVPKGEIPSSKFTN